MTKIRVRFAPSPTGPLHLGGVRTALYNYLFAKKNNGAFILRIEDTDQNRFVPGAEQYIMDSLEWCGIKVDEGIREGGNFAPYRQSERKEIYKKYADILVENGNAYYAFDTPEALEQLRKDNPNFAYNAHVRNGLNNSLNLPQTVVNKKIKNGEPYVIRIKVPAETEIGFEDMVRGAVSFQSAQIDDKVMFKSDGMPTYHLANVVDDHLMEISHVIRGEEWLPSTPVHVLLYNFLGWQDTMPQFAHLPLILKPDGNGKLSKRDGDRLGFPVFPLNWTNPDTGEKSQGFKERGFLPEAFVNFLAMLGWNPGTEQEIFSMEELVQLFSIEKLHKSGAKFDFEKAKWFNASYIKLMESNEIADRLPEQDAHKNIDRNYLIRAIDLIKERLVFLQDVQLFPYLFDVPKQYDEANLAKLASIKTNFNSAVFEQKLNGISEFNAQNIETGIKEFAGEHQIKVGEMMKFLRISLVGELSGPAIPDLIVLLGKAETMERVEMGYAFYAKND
jgi:glutamyl-tRNA synthetase